MTRAEFLEKYARHLLSDAHPRYEICRINNDGVGADFAHLDRFNGRAKVCIRCGSQRLNGGP